MKVPQRSDEKEAGLGMETLELKSEEKIKVLNGACMAEIKANLPELSGKVGGKKVEVLQDTGCSGVIIRRELVDEADFTRKMGHIMTKNSTLKRALMAKVEVDTLFYVGTVEALCLQDPLFDLIIGNVPGARRSDDPNPEWGVVTTVATRVQARSGKDPKSLKMKEVTDKITINKKDFIKMQDEDPTLQKLKQLKGTETRKGYVVSYEKRIAETATPGRRDIPGEPWGETQLGCGCVQSVQGRHPQVAAVGQVGTNLVEVQKNAAEEVSVNEEDLLGLVTFQSKESIQDMCVGAELNGEQQEKVVEVLRRYDEIFTKIPGKASMIEHKNDLTDDRPIRCKSYPLPYAKRGEIREEIKNMMDTRIVRESSSPYTSLLVVVKKKDSSNRMCIDYRKLNLVTVADPAPITVAKDLFGKLKKC